MSNEEEQKPLVNSSHEPQIDLPLDPAEPITRKDPKRVEQGKRLAKISRAAKERKMRDRIEKEIRSESYLPNIPRPFLLGAPLICAYILYSSYRSHSSGKSKENHEKPVVNQEMKEQQEEKNDRREKERKFATLD